VGQFSVQINKVATYEPKTKRKKPLAIAEGGAPYGGGQFDILAIIAARNEQEEKIGTLIKDFEEKIIVFFDFIRKSSEGERLMVKIKSHVSENEIYDDFAKIYRRYKALHRQSVGDYFFKEMEDLVEKLCDDFEVTVRNA
jgi:type I restriction enzyme R subunit